MKKIQLKKNPYGTEEIIVAKSIIIFEAVVCPLSDLEIIFNKI
jgi:hypothetical protein